MCPTFIITDNDNIQDILVSRNYNARPFVQLYTSSMHDDMLQHKPSAVLESQFNHIQYLVRFVQCDLAVEPPNHTEVG
jgi:hypothetical protein